MLLQHTYNEYDRLMTECMYQIFINSGGHPDDFEKYQNMAWCDDGLTYKDRIKKHLNHIWKSVMIYSISGIGSIDKFINTLIRQADNLLLTEKAFFQTSGQITRIKSRYIVKNIIDGRTCRLCNYMNNKIFKKSEMKYGVNAPPFHTRCRGWIEAYD